MNRKAILLLWNGMALFAGRLTDNAPHRHHAIQVCMALDAPFQLQSGGISQDYVGAVVASDHVHQFNGGNGIHLLLLIEPESKAGLHLQSTCLQDKPVTVLKTIKQKSVILECLRQVQADLSCVSAARLRATLLAEIGLMQSPDVYLEERIRKALLFMKQTELHKISSKDIAASVALSETRLAHLFKENVGIPIRRYLLWLKLIEAVNCMMAANSLTDAAHHAGFSDSAHLSRTFRKMFGFRPSNIFKNDQFVQVIPCVN